MSAIAVIPARGGSIRIPRKNIRQFFGRPIMAYSIEAARSSGLFDQIIVSTDDDEIADVSGELGADIFRRETDDGSKGTQQVAADVLRAIPFSPGTIACCIYPCAPMLTPEDLRYAVEFMGRLAWPPYVFVPGTLYCGLAQSFVDGVPLGLSDPRHPDPDKNEGSLEIGIYPAERYIDINTEEDWTRAERMYAALHKGKS